MEDAFGIVANVVSDSVLRTGAKVWICYCNGDAEKPRVWGLSRGGRPIEKYTAYKRLTNFRAAWIPENLRTRVSYQYGKKADAEQHAESLAKQWAGVRSFRKDGSMIQDGKSVGEAFRKHS